MSQNLTKTPQKPTKIPLIGFFRRLYTPKTHKKTNPENPGWRTLVTCTSIFRENVILHVLSIKTVRKEIEKGQELRVPYVHKSQKLQGSYFHCWATVYLLFNNAYVPVHCLPLILPRKSTIGLTI